MNWGTKVTFNGKLYVVSMRAEDNVFGLLGITNKDGQIFIEQEEAKEVENEVDSSVDFDSYIGG